MPSIVLRVHCLSALPAHSPALKKKKKKKEKVFQPSSASSITRSRNVTPCIAAKRLHSHILRIPRLPEFQPWNEEKDKMKLTKKKVRGEGEGGWREGGGRGGRLRTKAPVVPNPKTDPTFTGCSLPLQSLCNIVGCLTPQQNASVSQGRICSDNFTWCHTEKEVADPTFHLTQSQYTDTRPTSPSTDPITPGAWQSSHWSAILLKSLV